MHTSNAQLIYFKSISYFVKCFKNPLLSKRDVKKKHFYLIYAQGSYFRKQINFMKNIRIYKLLTLLPSTEMIRYKFLV